MRDDRLWIRIHTDGLGSGETWQNTGGMAETLAGAIVTSVNIPNAEPKTNTVDVPGMSGVLDFSEINGLFFKNRTITISMGLKEGATFNFSQFKKDYLGRVVDIMVDLTPNQDKYAANLPYYTGRLTIQNDNNRNTLREFDIVLDAEPFQYGPSHSSVLNNMRNILAVTDTVPEIFSLSNADCVRYPNAQKIMVQSDVPGGSVMFRETTVKGNTYVFGTQIQGGSYSVLDSEGNELGCQFAAPGTEIFIKVKTDGSNFGYIADENGNMQGKYIAMLTFPTMVLGGVSWNDVKTEAPEITASEDAHVLFDGKLVVVAAGTSVNPECVIHAGTTHIASTNASGLASGTVTIRKRRAYL